MFNKPSEILEYFKNWKLDDEGRDYLKDHAKRWIMLLDEIEKIIAETGREDIMILDIGPSFQSELVRKRWPKAIVDTLGFVDDRFKSRAQDKHFEFDLNDCRNSDKSKPRKYKIIIFAEVLEHLYTAPELIYGCLKDWLEEDGYIITQTPNAVALRSRVKTLFGKNPYNPIRSTLKNPSHFHEYTKRELLDCAKQAKLSIVKLTYHNYFRKKNKVAGFVYDLICGLFPSTRDGITFIVKK